MESIAEKLKILDSRIGTSSMSPPSVDRLSFVVQQPTQRELFLEVGFWLIERLDRTQSEFSYAQRRKSVEDLVTDVSERKILQQCGEEAMRDFELGRGKAVCRVLDSLCDLVLAKVGFRWQRPFHTICREIPLKADSKETEAVLTSIKESFPMLLHLQDPSADDQKNTNSVKGCKAERKNSDHTSYRLHDQSESKEQRYKARVLQLKSQVIDQQNVCQLQSRRIQVLKNDLRKLNERCVRLQQKEREALSDNPLGCMSSPEASADSKDVTCTPPIVRLKIADMKMKEEIPALKFKMGIIRHSLFSEVSYSNSTHNDCVSATPVNDYDEDE